MSRRYEFLEESAELLTPAELAELEPEVAWTDDDMGLAIGNPYATAGVIAGSQEHVIRFLAGLLAIAEAGAKGEQA